jgi:DNA-binding transcriptional ArsR family regulator
MSPTTLPEPAAVFAALGDRTRLQLIERLAGGEDLSIQDLAAGSPISRQGTTKHLRVLEEAGLVRSTRYGREVRFRLEQEEIERAQAFLTHVSRQWSNALARLAEHVKAR